MEFDAGSLFGFQNLPFAHHFGYLTQDHDVGLADLLHGESCFSRILPAFPPISSFHVVRFGTYEVRDGIADSYLPDQEYNSCLTQLCISPLFVFYRSGKTFSYAGG